MTAGIVAAATMTLASCGTDVPAELSDVRWQVSRIEDEPAADTGTAVSSSLSQYDQVRTWMAFGGETSFTGAAGCMDLSGSVEWLEDEKVRINDLSSRDTSDDDGGTPCGPNDSSIADRLTELFDDATLSWSTPGDEELRLTLDDDKVDDWQTKRFVQFIAAP
jgi:hypothetical protein